MTVNEDIIITNRIKLVGIGLLVVAGIICMRLVHVQFIKHDYYSLLASEEHFSKYQIPAIRGKIFLKDRGKSIPVVFNQNLKILYADTRYVANHDQAARQLAELTGDNPDKYQEALKAGGAYVVLNREIESDLAERIKNLSLSGIGLSDSSKRVNPEGSLAAHVLGFVNSDGIGQYGIEQQFNDFLAGSPGLLDAKTDTNGIPIATSDNVQLSPTHGGDVVLTIDRNLQAVVERVLKNGTRLYGAQSSSAVVIDPSSGAILAMANYPTFEPEKYAKSRFELFHNIAVNGQFEPGSGFKAFAMAAGIDSGAVAPGTTYYDKGEEVIDGFTIRNAEGSGGVVRDMTQVITNSVNTGVVFVLRQLGGGSINDQAKNRLYNYYGERFGFGQQTGIELPNEAAGQLPTPDSASNVAYANMAFGQGLTANMVQIVSAYSALVNGGTVYKPHIVSQLKEHNGEIRTTSPEVVKNGIISQETTNSLKTMLETVVESGGGFGTKIEGYRIGGKTGTAQIPNPEGGYYFDRDIGSFIGFAPFEKPQIVMMIRVDRPTRAPGFAGSAAAGPMFGEIMEWFLRYYGVQPDAQ
jgi:cell division protein FtsI/penicillin-binding protein 2